MANTIKIKNSGTATSVPSSLQYGELAINYADGKMFYKNSSNSIISTKLLTNIVGTTNEVSVSESSGTFTISLPDSISVTTVNTSGDTNVTGKLSVLASSGDEGGEIFLAKAQTNSTLDGGVTIDVYQNKIRFFEQGGSARGAYIDLTAATGGAGTNLLSGGGASTLDGLTDVTAPSPSSGDFLKYNGSAWVNDPINLSTDTTGDYVAALVAGTGITVSNNSGEGATPTIALTNSSITINGTSISLGSTGTITAAAGTLTGSTLASGVTSSSLTSVGILNNLVATTSSTSTVPLTIKQVANQSAALVEFRDSSNNVMSKVDYAGTFWSQYSIIGNTSGYPAGTTLAVNSVGSSSAAIIAKAASGQTANILEIQNSSGTVLAKIDSAGVITSTSNIISHIATNPQSASYTLVLADDGKIIEVNNGSANTVTIPLNSSVAFPIGTQITVLQTGAGQTTIAATGGVTLNATPGLKLRAQWSSVTLIKRGTDTWVAVGDLMS
jgi:hypothetical protein